MKELNPLFAPGASIDEMVAQGMLPRDYASIFRKDKSERDDRGRPLRRGIERRRMMEGLKQD